VHTDGDQLPGLGVFKRGPETEEKNHENVVEFKHTIGGYRICNERTKEEMKTRSTTHFQELARLKKIEGQIRGIQKMIEEKKYCIDILTQLSAVSGAIMRVEESILSRHLEGCVYQSFSKGSYRDREEKMGEIITLLKKFRKY
jgi:DNA-binding FrmR family transcriptional regulator